MRYSPSRQEGAHPAPRHSSKRRRPLQVRESRKGKKREVYVQNLAEYR